VEPGESFNVAYYATVATLIPVLIVVLFIQAGFTKGRLLGEWEWGFFSLSVVALLVVAEGNVLNALHERENLLGLRDDSVGLALFLGLSLVLFGQIGQQMPSIESDYRFRGVLVLGMFLGNLAAVLLLAFAPDPFYVLSLIGVGAVALLTFSSYRVPPVPGDEEPSTKAGLAERETA